MIDSNNLFLHSMDGHKRNLLNLQKGKALMLIGLLNLEKYGNRIQILIKQDRECKCRSSKTSRDLDGVGNI